LRNICGTRMGIDFLLELMQNLFLLLIRIDQMDNEHSSDPQP
jgi:hypothetical protein